MCDAMKNGVAGDSTGREVKKVTRLHSCFTGYWLLTCVFTLGLHIHGLFFVW